MSDNDQKDFFAKLLGIEEAAEKGQVADRKTRGRNRIKPEAEKSSIDQPKMIIEKGSEETIEPDIFDESEGQLTIDVYQTPTSIIVESALAGVNAEELDIAITAESVSIRGKREKIEKVEEKDYLYQECYWGRFSRSIILPQEIDPDRAQASLKNGVLKIVLPKLNKQKTKKLKVKFD
ncbi:MAG: Hsp20/alpha crystallin family protein [Candidatus Paceibacterota bacterium]|jgi:HSP20 family protein